MRRLAASSRWITTAAQMGMGFILPFALTLFGPELDQWSPGEHNGTFRGNNHAFVTARTALEKFWATDAFAADVARKGEYLGERLAAIAEAHGLSLRGRGMMRGIDVGSGEIAALITTAAFERGLIIETSCAHDEIVKVLAPLIIDDALLAQGLDILEDCVRAALEPAYGVADRVPRVHRLAAALAGDVGQPAHRLEELGRGHPARLARALPQRALPDGHVRAPGR